MARLSQRTAKRIASLFNQIAVGEMIMAKSTKRARAHADAGRFAECEASQQEYKLFHASANKAAATLATDYGINVIGYSE